MMENIKSEILRARSRLAHCLNKDAWRLEKALRELEQKLKENGQARDESGKNHTAQGKSAQILEKLIHDIECSEKAVEERRKTVPVLNFPPELPVTEKLDDIEAVLTKSQVLIVAGETGSGKTTQLPKLCLRAGLGLKGLIGHTQPRRLAARSVAGRIAQECGTELGNLVGYQVRFHEQVSDQSLIKLMTDGILLAEIQNDPYLKKYQVLIVDEAHERSLNIDFLLGYLRTLLPKRPDLKLIITSATIDVERFSEFFHGAPVINVSGRTYPVDVQYRPLQLIESEEEDLSVQLAIGQVLDEIEQVERESRQLPGDVLIFMTGERDIRETAHYLRDRNLKNVEVMPLYARLGATEQARIFQPARGRKIVLATNVAETSITVPGIRYVIDPGKARISRYSYRSKVQRLPVEAISQASANQRKGRCGRVESGICYRLYSEEDFASRPEFTDPEIVRTNLASVILQMAQLNIGDIKRFPFLQRPDSRLISDGYKLLFELGAVNDANRLTQVGKLLAKIPADPRLARILVEANKNNCLSEALIICSVLAIQDPKEKPHDKQQAANQAHKLFEDKDSDFVSYFNLWNALEAERQQLTSNQFRKFCQKNYISYLRYREWRDLHRQLHLILKELKMQENKSPAGYETIHKSLLSGLLGHVGMKDEKNIYKGARNKQFYIFPGSALYKPQPKWVMSAELVETSKLYARTVAKIEPEWVEALAAHLTKRSYFEPHWEKKRGQVVGYVNISLYGLPIVQKRPVNYAQVDLPLSREIFIRSALVEEDIQTKAPFYRNNCQLIQRIIDQEEKTRRRDILVEDEMIYQLYDRIIPPDVVSVRHFDAWWKSLEKNDLDSLNFTEEQLTKEASEWASGTSFPDFYQTDSVKFKLDYKFNPGESNDGVTLITPIAALKQLSDKRLEWIVPGFLKEKCTQLIKGLPKQYRKHFVPVPDYVEKVVPKLTNSSDSLIAQLAKQLRFMTGVNVPMEVWQNVTLAPHLQINMRIVDADGKKLYESRNLDDIIEKYGNEKTQVKAVEKMEGTWGQQGIHSWSFGALPQEIKKKQAGVTIRMFPYLKDERKSVSLLASTDELFAKKQHENGLARLVMFAWTDHLSFIESELPLFHKSALLFAPTGKRVDLLDDFFMALIKNYVFSGGLPKDREQFTQMLLSKKSGFHEAAMSFDQTVFSIIKPYHECMKKTKGKLNLALAASISDLRNQLGALVYAGFLSQTPWEWLIEMPRYFEAALIRIEKMSREMKREREFLLFMAGCEEKFQKLEAHNKKHGIESRELMSYRWMLEEFRVSYFAQQLGTKMTVSDKRLEKQWQAVQDELL